MLHSANIFAILSLSPQNLFQAQNTFVGSITLIWVVAHQGPQPKGVH